MITRVLIEYIPRAGYIEVNESSIYVCINVLCVMTSNTCKVLEVEHWH